MITLYLAKRDNLWELLILALVLFAAGMVMVLQDGPMIAIASETGRTSRNQPAEALSPVAAHAFGALTIAFSALVVLLYFRVRRASARDRTRVVEHGREII